MNWQPVPLSRTVSKEHLQIFGFSKSRGIRLFPSCYLDLPSFRDVVAWMPAPERPHICRDGWLPPDVLPEKSGDVCVALQSEAQAMEGRSGVPFITYYSKEGLFCSCGTAGPLAWRPLPKPPKSHQKIEEEA